MFFFTYHERKRRSSLFGFIVCFLKTKFFLFIIALFDFILLCNCHLLFLLTSSVSDNLVRLGYFSTKGHEYALPSASVWDTEYNLNGFSKYTLPFNHHHQLPLYNLTVSLDDL